MKLLTTIHNQNNIKAPSVFADGFLLGNENYAVRLTKSFSIDEMIPALETVSSLKKESFILMNQMFTDHELTSAKSFIQSLPADLINGFIIADLGLVDIFKELKLIHKVIYNPETLLTNHFDFNYLSTDGLFGAFVSKEITLKDILEIGNHKAYKLFMYGHGHMSMFYSKRQILTAYTDYLLKDSIYHEDQSLSLQEPKRDKENYPILEDHGGTHVFRGHIFQSLDDLDDLKKVVDYLIFDTIFQDDHYAQTILSIYHEGKPSDESVMQLKSKYNEQWTNGFLHQKTIYKGKVND